MTQITINVPDHLKMPPEEIKKFLAAKLYQAEKIDLAQAAQMAGETETAFVEIMRGYGVSVIKEPAARRTRDAGQF
ncbi:MAG: UPF0175 family protein [Bacteroidales bacterium]